MKLEQLLTDLQNQRHRILPKLGRKEKNELRDVLAKLSTALSALERAKDTVIDYCWEHSYLSAALEEDGAPKKSIIRGRPNPRPLSKQTEQLRLLADRLIAAIDETTDKN